MGKSICNFLFSLLKNSSSAKVPSTSAPTVVFPMSWLLPLYQLRFLPFPFLFAFPQTACVISSRPTFMSFSKMVYLQFSIWHFCLRVLLGTLNLTRLNDSRWPSCPKKQLTLPEIFPFQKVLSPFNGFLGLKPLKSSLISLSSSSISIGKHCWFYLQIYPINTDFSSSPVLPLKS